MTWTSWLKDIAYFTAHRCDDAIGSFGQVRDPINEVRGWLAASGRAGRTRRRSIYRDGGQRCHPFGRSDQCGAGSTIPTGITYERWGVEGDHPSRSGGHPSPDVSRPELAFSMRSPVLADLSDVTPHKKGGNKKAPPLAGQV
jgi:hypothetical protein